MAAFDLQGSASRFLFDNGEVTGEQQLPTGACGFRDLSIDARAPTCGCKSFWLSNNLHNGQDGPSPKAWCFCGHHACFHDAFSQQRGFSHTSLGAAVDVPRENAQLPTQAIQPQGYESQPKPTGLGIQPGSSAHSQSINTRLWDALNAFARGQEDGPPSDTTSKLPSTACPSVAGEQPRASPSRMLLESVHHLCPMGPPVNIPYGEHDAATVEDLYSATEVATPSARGTPDLRAFAPPGSQRRTSPSSAQAARLSPAANRNATAQRPVDGVGTARQSSNVRVPPVSIADSSHEVGHLLQSLSRRVEVLESLSFSHVPVEVVEDRLDLLDTRILDLEQWRSQKDESPITTGHAGPSNAKRRRLLPAKTNSFSSEESFDSAAAAHTEAVVLATLAANSETGPRIDALERRVIGLEHASLPSFERPWQVQVVLLPWGCALCGIWFSALEATQHSLKSSTHASEDWTGAQSIPKLSFNNGTWTTESIEAWANDAHEWLSPKACGPSGMVFQRLESRGLVQSVTLTAPDSRHVLGTISAAFGHVFGDEDAAATHDDQHQALSERFIPLRKVRKSSRLRFLSPAEMVTSASWTAGFLDSSVCMKVNDGQRRLYITTSDAYLQAECEGWSWQRLKHLPIHDASGDEKAVRAKSNVIEACWTYNDRLDQPVSFHASFTASHDSLFSSDNHQSRFDAEAEQVAGDDSQRDKPVLDPQQRHHRTVSLPSFSSAAEQNRVALPKRRVASFETAGTVPLINNQRSDIAAYKRRRVSISPEAERRGVGFTPRMSREPPSPFMSEPACEAHSQGNVSRKRGMTPFAYATPHSNNTFGPGRMEYSGGDGDTEADTDMAVPHTEDEWQGVGDDPDTALPECESAIDEPEIDEENLHEGLSSYVA